MVNDRLENTMDGTFNQVKPLSFLKGEKMCYSYDLTSATDRWPVFLLYLITQSLFGRGWASSAVNSALTANIFTVPFVKTKASAVAFAAGQPLGYFSSWPLFSLSHHFVIWLAAEQVYPGTRFTKYARG